MPWRDQPRPGDAKPLVMLLQNPVEADDADRPENVYARLAPGAFEAARLDPATTLRDA
jgi:hypothetical protein